MNFHRSSWMARSGAQFMKNSGKYDFAVRRSGPLTAATRERQQALSLRAGERRHAGKIQ